MKEVWKSLLDALQGGKDAVLCSLIAVSGSTPRRAGAKMAVFSDGTSVGTIGGGTAEFEALQAARSALQTRVSCIRNFQIQPNDASKTDGSSVTVYIQVFQATQAQHLHLVSAIVDLSSRPVDAWLITEIGDSGWDSGIFDSENGLRFLPAADLGTLRPLMTRRAVLMEGERLFFVEPISSAGCLYVLGGGHVAQALVPLLSSVGFRVTVLENRPEFAQKALFPTADQVVQAELSALTQRFTVSEQDGILILTRGRQDDYEVLRQALATKAGYVGVISSRRRAAQDLERLRCDGVTTEEIRRLHSPIGLPIGAETPEEIAVSVAAELIAYRAANSVSDRR